MSAGLIDARGLTCSLCGWGSTVEDSRTRFVYVWRRRKCRNPECNVKFSSVEIVLIGRVADLLRNAGISVLERKPS